MTAIDTAFHGLRHMIGSGRLSAGEKLPPEADLCAELGVSRGSLREAVRMLAALGVLRARHGSGVYVSALHPEDIIGSLALTVDLLPLSGLLDMYEIRRVLEAHAASRAAARADADDAAALDELVTAMSETDQSERLSELDARFHETIARLSGNPTLVAFLDVLRSRSRAYRLYDLSEEDDVRRTSLEGHRRMAAAISAGDPVLAAAEAAAHVAQTESWLRAYRPDPTPSPAESAPLPSMDEASTTH